MNQRWLANPAAGDAQLPTKVRRPRNGQRATGTFRAGGSFAPSLPPWNLPPGLERFQRLARRQSSTLYAPTLPPGAALPAQKII